MVSELRLLVMCCPARGVMFPVGCLKDWTGVSLLAEGAAAGGGSAMILDGAHASLPHPEGRVDKGAGSTECYGRSEAAGCSHTQREKAKRPHTFIENAARLLKRPGPKS